MIPSMSISAFTSVHVAMSLVAMLAGFFVVRSLFASRKPAATTAFFLLTAVATSLGSFCFPFTQPGLGHVVGILSLLVLAVTMPARYGFRLAGPWRWIYAAGATSALYLDVVIGVAQIFAKTPLLQSLAPTQAAPLFLAAQCVVLAIFGALGVRATRRFHPETAPLPARRSRLAVWI